MRLARSATKDFPPDRPKPQPMYAPQAPQLVPIGFGGAAVPPPGAPPGGGPREEDGTASGQRLASLLSPAGGVALLARMDELGLRTGETIQVGRNGGRGGVHGRLGMHGAWCTAVHAVQCLRSTELHSPTLWRRGPSLRSCLPPFLCCTRSCATSAPSPARRLPVTPPWSAWWGSCCGRSRCAPTRGKGGKQSTRNMCGGKRGRGVPSGRAGPYGIFHYGALRVTTFIDTCREEGGSGTLPGRSVTDRSLVRR